MPETVRSLVHATATQLSALIRPMDQRWFEAELLVGQALKQDRTWVALHPTNAITPKQVRLVKALVARRLKHEPLAYLLAQAPFFNHSFFVDKGVLIPRPESEWLVHAALKHIDDNEKNWVVWDVGTGSGCLALSMAHALPRLSVLASDRSRGALHVAQDNARRLHVKNVTFVNGSLLSQGVIRQLRPAQDKHWLIIANLPYLPLADRSKLQKQVVEHEPSHALFAPDDGLALIKQLLQQLQRFQKTRTGDVILLEHDPRQARELLTYSKILFPNATITSEKDQNNAKRFTMVVLQKSGHPS